MALTHPIDDIIGFEHKAYKALRQHWEDLMAQMNLSSFAYLQFYDNGNFINLCSDQNWSKKYYRMEKIDTHYLQQIIKARNTKDFHTYFWPQDPLKGEITTWLIDHGIGTGFTIFKGENQMVHGWGFSGKTECTDLMNFYIQNKEYLFKFCLEFAAMYKTYQTQQQKIYYGHMGTTLFEEDYNLSNIQTSNISPSQDINKIMLFTGQGSEIITKQLWQIIDLQAQGYCQKQMAAKLNISPKTVEQRLLTLRTKLGVYSRDQLFEIWKKNKGV